MRAVALSRGEQEEHSNYQRGGTIKANNLTEDIFRTKSGEAGSIQRSTGSSENLPSTESHTIPEAAPRFVERRTGLRGQGIAPAWISPRTIRKNTEDELKERVVEFPYDKAEQALRDLVCSLMERQDRMNEEILLRVIDLQYRMDDLEADLPALKRKKNTVDPEAPG